MDKLKVALQISSGFEGGGFDNVTGNFDGQGISAGALQWNYGQGTLQQLLERYISEHGQITGFPEDINASASMDPDHAVQFAVSTMLVGTKLKPEWAQAWKTFLASTPCVLTQLELAQPLGRYADYMCGIWKLSSLRAYCFFFDVRVQNGSMLGLPGRAPSIDEYNRIAAAADPQNAAIWQHLVPTNEQMVLMQAAWDRSQKAKPAYQANILARKGTIAMGMGYVNGASRNLSSLLAG